MSAFTYQQAVEVLRSALTFGIDPSLEPIRAMCAALGNPQERYRVVQVAGTNGKSSTTRMVAALLHSQGMKVGLYTSPHLVKYPERIEVDGEIVSDELFAAGIDAALGAARDAGVEATEFELLTCAALWLFAREGARIAVLECGLGGRWDATSVCDPEVVVVTGIGLDHTAILGDTLEDIAAEKAAIIKPGCTAVLADGIAAAEVFERRAAEVGASVAHVDEGLVAPWLPCISHMPAYQRANLATALVCVGRVAGGELDLAAAQDALRSLQVPGRFETLREDPLLLIDAAHNPQSAQVLARELLARFAAAGEDPQGRPPMPSLLLGVLADKDAWGIAEALAPLFEQVVVTRSESSRSLDPDTLAMVVEGAAPMARVETAPDIATALQVLEGEPVVATGSITVAGEVKRVWC